MKFRLIPVASLALVALASPLAARGPLSFEERVRAQEAIERVYYAHRIWPKENPGPKPPFEQMVPKAELEAKVIDSLKKSAALDRFWQRSLEPAQLQAEMERMARDTRDPATLRDLFAALGDDPELIAECLARPVLADRLLNNWYAFDERFHGALKARAEAALAAGPDTWASEEGARYWHGCMTRDEDGAGPADEGAAASGTRRLDRQAFDEWMREAPQAGRTALRETREGFLLIATSARSDAAWEGETCSWAKRPLDDWWKEERESLPRPEEEAGAPSTWRYSMAFEPPCTIRTGWASPAGLVPPVPEPRRRHTAVWTGTEMIVWGGEGDYGTILNTGGRYTPSTDSWVGTSTTGAPAPRYYHDAVWTGTEMIVWGAEVGGGRYNPSTDSWRATATENQPYPRNRLSAVWTGTEMIVWGGSNLDPFDTGGRYNPTSDTWVATSTINAPSARYDHTAVWTGSEMVVWGGLGTAPLLTGGRYNPATDSWTATSTTAGVPSLRYGHTAVWTGTVMIIWGGYSGSTYLWTGSRYNPSTNSWAAVTVSNGPAARDRHTAVWTGIEMIVWGGVGELNTGARYNPTANTWTATSTAGAPAGRTYHTAVWTGTEMIVWGGETTGTAYLDTGGRYKPSTNSWLPTATTGAPVRRYRHAAVWTGAEMIVWGGNGDNQASLNSGGRYTPATDSWTATDTTGAPSARERSTAVWTGSVMIVWGGKYLALGTGGRYSPATNTWTATSTAGAPFGRYGHVAVWTGSEMIVWGGMDTMQQSTDTGGRYNPNADTWAATETPGAPTPRTGAAAVWTGSEMIVWGGTQYPANYLTVNTGGRYSPSTGSWVATGTAGAPLGRAYHSAVWTGAEMIIWGGSWWAASHSEYFEPSGGRYDPASDAWVPTSLAEAPLKRKHHTALWTGSGMLVWGGDPSADSGFIYGLNTGGEYDLAADSWSPAPTAGAPSARTDHTAIWTGTEMIVWGGDYGSQPFDTGGTYSTGVPLWGPGALCQGSEIVLSTRAYSSYQWYRDGAAIPGATAQHYTATQGGTYTVAVTDGGGCTGTAAGRVVTEDPPPASPGESLRLALEPNVVLTWAECAGADSYKLWINKNPQASPAGFELVVKTADTIFFDSRNLPSGEVYWYFVEALTGNCATP